MEEIQIVPAAADFKQWFLNLEEHQNNQVSQILEKLVKYAKS
jgi:hypothetical protein